MEVLDGGHYIKQEQHVGSAGRVGIYRVGASTFFSSTNKTLNLEQKLFHNKAFPNATEFNSEHFFFSYFQHKVRCSFMLLYVYYCL